MEDFAQSIDASCGDEVVDIPPSGAFPPSQTELIQSRTWSRVPDSVVKSAGRTLQILEFFDDMRRPVNMTEISRGLGYPESSTSLLLRSLVTLGYLDYDRHRRKYRVTSRVRLLGSWIDTDLFQNDKVLHLMEELNAEAEDAIILASRNGLNAQYIHIVQARTALRLHLTPGTERSIVQSTTGLVMLSRLSDSEIAVLVRRANAELDSLDDIVRLPDLMRQIDIVRRDGYILSESRITSGCSVLAMPLPQHLTEGTLVLAIGGPSERLGEHRRSFLVELMQRRIREHLGE